MTNIPSVGKDMQNTEKDFEAFILEKLEQLKTELCGGLDIYTNKRIQDEMAGYISNDTIARLRESGELPAKKVKGKWYYKGTDIRKVFTQTD